MVVVSADVGGVVADLKRIDPCLNVRFAEHGNPPFWAVYWQSPDGRDTYLVTTAQAYENSFGVWEGLDHRMVEKFHQIDPRNGYDYVAEIDRVNREAKAAEKHEFRERAGEIGEQAAHAVRKDMGSTAKAFIPRNI
jgi:hypothetical protein